MSAAEAGEQGDLVALDRRLDIECHAVADTTACTFAGSTVDATRYPRVYAAQNHGGAWNTGAYNLTTSGTGSPIAININFIRFEGLQVDCTNAGTTAIGNFTFAAITGAGVGYVERCLVRRTAQPTSGAQTGIRSTDVDWTLNIANCVIWYEGTPAASGAAISLSGSGGTFNVYNNTVVGWVAGMSRGGGTFLAKNNLVQCTTGFSGTMAAGSNYNASSDATAPGANSRQSQTFTFVNAGAYDYHLAAGDAGAKGFGTDLSADATYPISVDVDNATRTVPWDIGADQTVAAGGSVIPVFMAQYRQRWG